MYHQFLKLADIDITRQPMEVGPTTHYIMGGIRVDADTQMATVPGLFAAGECAAGLHGANRLGGNSLSDLLVFGKRAGEFAARFARENAPATVKAGQLDQYGREALRYFETEGTETPFQVQADLQGMMQDLVGIVRNETDMLRAWEELKMLRERAARVHVTGNREFNPGWHTALDLENLLTVSEAITLAALERKESQGAHFREDYPQKDEKSGKFNIVIRKGEEGRMELRREPLPELPAELQQIIKEMK
jgi:succinate dehydrogenase / fumarate reductase flavoprotein subunit